MTTSRRLFRATAPILIAAMLAGCGAQRELAVVTETATVTPADNSPPTSHNADGAESTDGGAETKLESPELRAGEAAASGSVSAVMPGRFDNGKMWTFEDAPVAYFKEAYGFEPSDRWFSKARAGALRFSTYCSASFVSPHGLVMTNHHCARQSVTAVSKEGEELLDNGFTARSVDAERRVEDLFVDQLISISDVTDEVTSVVTSGMSDEASVEARSGKASAVARRLTREASDDSTFVVEVVALYNGSRYSAYKFRRYTDVRLVMAPELEIGFFGGDHDNFTYPRYNLDAAFFRVYGDGGSPLATKDYFAWSADGAREGDAVFVVGSPGSTSRLSTVAQLVFERDVALPQQLRVLESRAAVLKEFIEAYPDEAEEYDLRNAWFSLENSIKANKGQLEGLNGPVVLPRKAAGEAGLRDSIAARSRLELRYGSLLEDIERIQRAKRAVADQSGAFTMFSSETMTSHLLLRALYGYVHDLLKQRGAPEDRVNEMREGGLAVSDWPPDVDRGFIAARLEELRDYLGPQHPTVRSLLKGDTPDSVAARVVRSSALSDSAGFAALLDEGYLSSSDSSVEVIKSIGSLFFSIGQQLSSFESREENLNAKYGRLLYDVFGTAVAPDASFSLRISDGVVAPYSYNGTEAPAFTSFYGLYDRHHSFGTIASDWSLPERWVDGSETLDLSTPLNLVSTNDITGGNSGSPLLNTNLEIVGLVFDSNIEALPNEYLYRNDQGRTISVDSRGIIEALDHVYDSDRIVLELRSGRLIETEEEADEQQGM